MPAGSNDLFNPNSSGLGAGVSLTAWKTQKVAHDVSVFHGMFTFDVPASMWVVEENGTENLDLSTSTRAYSTDGQLEVVSGTTAGDTTFLYSKRHPRYQPNRGHLYSSSGGVKNPDADGVVDWGLFTDDNGVFFRHGTDGLLYACLLSGGVLVKEEEITNLPSGFIAADRGNTWDIQFQWRGVGNYYFYVGCPDHEYPVLAHKFKFLGKTTAITLQNPALPIGFRAANVTQEKGFWCGCVDVTSEGGGAVREQYTSAYTDNLTANGTDVPILAIRQPESINGSWNTRDARLARVVVQCDKKATFKVWTTRDPTAFTGGTFAAVNSGSYIETDSPNTATGAAHVTAVDTAKLHRVTAIKAQANDRTLITNPSPETIEFFVSRRDHVVITVTVASGACDAEIELGDEI